MNILLLLELPDDVLRRIAAIAPQARTATSSSDADDYREQLAQAHIIVGRMPTEDFQYAQQLRWLHLASAGATRYAQDLPDDVLLTNSSGAYGIPIAEHVLAMMLALTRHVPQAVRDQAQQHWPEEKDTGGRRELFEQTCGVIGLGDIGTEVARRAHALGMHVLAVKREVTTKPAFVDELWTSDQLDALLERADHVVVTVPGTNATEHLIDARRIGRMRREAIIYNVGRGSTIDQDALVEALREGRLAGAGLDVTEPEPLPDDHPLWKLPNVVVTPHVAGDSPQIARRVGKLFCANLEAYLEEREMPTLVDRKLGY